MRYINLFLALLFALFAVVQLNDPDPWGWVAMYGFVAVVSAFAAFGRYHRYLLYLGMGVVNSPHATLLNQQIAPERRSTMLSVHSLAVYLGGFIGGIGLGYVAEQWSIQVAWIMGSLILMVSLIPYLLVDAMVDPEGVDRVVDHEIPSTD